MGMSLEDLAQLIVSLSLGLGLSAACGFRIFVPMFGMSLGAKLGWMELSSGFEWLGSWPALIVFAVATVVEVVAYFFPWIDNLLDTVATPAAAIAGVVVLAASLVDVPPLMKWSVAAIAGGGSAGLIKAGMGLLRVGSTATTGGAANPGVSIAELLGSFFMTLLALILPVVAAVVAAVIMMFLVRVLWRGARRFLGGNQAKPEALGANGKANETFKSAGPHEVPPKVV